MFDILCVEKNMVMHGLDKFGTKGEAFLAEDNIGNKVFATKDFIEKGGYKMTVL